MGIRRLVEILTKCELFLFPGTPVETREMMSAKKQADAEAVQKVLNGRRFTRQPGPFTGFASPPGRF